MDGPLKMGPLSGHRETVVGAPPVQRCWWVIKVTVGSRGWRGLPLLVLSWDNLKGRSVKTTWSRRTWALSELWHICGISNESWIQPFNYMKWTTLLSIVNLLFMKIIVIYTVHTDILMTHGWQILDENIMDGRESKFWSLFKFISLISKKFPPVSSGIWTLSPSPSLACGLNSNVPIIKVRH